MRDDHSNTTGAEYSAGETPQAPQRPAARYDRARVTQVRQWADSRGYQVTLCHLKTKATVDERHKLEDYKSPPVDRWSQPHNMGVITGPRRGGPVDNDNDCPEAIFFAERFFPPTPAVFGRAGKPKSHRFFEVIEGTCPTLKFNDPLRDKKSNTILELRADANDGAHHTILPGSIHESGEAVWWSGEPQPVPEKVPTEDLTRAAVKVALATLVVRYVWNEGERNDLGKHVYGMLHYAGWSLGEAEEFIKAVLDYADDTHDRKSRLRTLQNTYARAKAGKKVTGATRLRKELQARNQAAVVDTMLEWMGAEKNVGASYNENFVVADVNGKCRIVKTDAEPGQPFRFYEKDAFFDLMSYDKAEMLDEKTGKARKVEKARLWWASHRPAPKVAVFRPGEPEERTPENILNTWTGWAVQPIDDPSKCRAWLELVDKVICGGDPATFDWLLNWAAHMLQYPMERPTTTPGIVGVPGAGKTLMCTYLSRILGDAGYWITSDADFLIGKFSGHLETTLLAVGEEAFYAKDKKSRAKLKSLITDEKRVSHDKYVRAGLVNNFMRLISLTNYYDGLPAEDRDRRNSVIDMNERRVSSQLKDQVVQEMAGDGPAALLGLLLSMTVDKDAVRRNLVNKALADAKDKIRDPVDAWWLDCLLSASLLPETVMWAQDPEKEDWPHTVGLDALEYAMRQHIKMHNPRTEPPNRQQLLTTLRKLTRCDDLGIQRSRIAFKGRPQANDDDDGAAFKALPYDVRGMNQQQRVIILPTLADCRASFEKKVGQPIEWDTDDNDPVKRVGTGDEPDMPPPSY